MEGFLQDVTERKEAAQALQEAERRYRSIFENAIEGVFQTTPDGTYIAVNPALARIYGYHSPEDLIVGLRDISHQLYVEPERRTEFMRLMEQHGSVSNFESRVYRRDGDIIWISENARAVYDDSGKLVCYEGTVEAITERKLYEAEMRHQATHDALTGLPNRNMLHEHLQRAIQVARQKGGLTAVAFWTWTSSSSSMTAWATRWAMNCSRPWRSACRPACATPTWWRARVATNSCWCCRTRPGASWASPRSCSASWPPWRDPGRPATANSRSPPVSG
jgi:PAS domain S-box-containing protein